MIKRETRARARTGSRCRDAADAADAATIAPIVPSRRLTGGWRARLDQLKTRLIETPCCRDILEQRTLLVVSSVPETWRGLIVSNSYRCGDAPVSDID